jgi:hypothetical protein
MSLRVFSFARFARSALFVLGLSLGTLSCRDLSRFDTHGELDAYCGELVSGPSFNDGFLPDGVPKVLKAKLTLETSALSTYSDNKATQPGRLWTNDADSGLCAAIGKPLFRNSPLRGIPQVDHDSLATMSFGEGHDEDFFAWTDSTCQGTMLAVVSLLRKGDVELRLFKPARLPATDAPAEERPGFAMFYLQRQKKGCGF